MLGSAALLATGRSLPAAEASYLEPDTLASYWTTLSTPGLLVSAAAALAGAILVANNRSILTAGVMVALALVPTATLAGMGIVGGDFVVALTAAGRWLLDVMLVLLVSAAVFAWKERTVQRRAMMGSASP